MKLVRNLLLISLSSLPISSLAANPNIVFFMVDDMGWQDCSLPFWKDTTLQNKMFSTPNLERLAARGVRFTNAYASAVSSPTRVSLMTGMNPASHRVSNWTLHKNTSTDGHSDVLDFPKWNVNGLQPVGSGIPQSVEAVTLPQLLKMQGYYNIHIGKAHFGAIGTPGANPLNLGFDVNVAGHAAGGLASYLGEQNFGNISDSTKQSPFAVPGLNEYWGKDIFVTEALTQKAIAELDKRPQDKPFFLYMSHYAIHVPFDKDNRYYQSYIDKGLSPQWAAYAALVEGMDKSLGDIMDYLDSTKLTENTIVIFMSDNGGLTVSGREKHPVLGHKANYPLNSGKGSSYEGGVRVPLVISLPKMNGTGTENPSVVEVCDMLPTIMKLSETKKYTTPQKIDGIDITPYIYGTQAAKERSIYWHFPVKWDAEQGPGIGTYSAIRRGDWKLIYFYETKKTELYNLKEDIFEIINQGDNPSQSILCKQMAMELTDYLKSTNAQLPKYKSAEYCRYPDGRKYKPRD